jgi:hypothetical protein
LESNPLPMNKASLERVLSAAWRELHARRGLRVTLAGIALLLFGLYLGGGSALTVPLIVIGGVLVLAGVLGPRLSGRLIVEWGPAGTTIDFHTDVAAPSQAEPVTQPAVAAIAQGGAAPPQVAAGPAGPPQVIEGRGETIEIEVAQLEALMAGARPQAER